MHSAALVVIGRPGAPGGVLDDPAPAAFPYTPVVHDRWVCDTGHVGAAVWRGSVASATWVGPTGLVAILGDARRGREPVSPDDLGEAPTTDLLGVHVAVVIRPDGSGAVWADRAGSTVLFLAEGRYHVAVATHPDLAARAVEPPGSPPPKDPLMGAILGSCRFPVGSRTGFARVRVMAPGEWLRLRPGRDPERRRIVTPWAEGAASATGDLAAPVAEVADALRIEVEAFHARPDASGVMDLTGGRDSRALLAVALRAGLADDLTYRTYGGPALADTRIATLIAERFGLRHESTLPRGGGVAGGWLDQSRVFLARTGGSINLWERCAPPPGPREVRVSGFPGEAIRGYYQPTTLPASGDAVVAYLSAKILGMPLVRDDALAEVRAELEAEIRACVDEVTDPAAALDVFALRNSLRFRAGPLKACEPDDRVVPFCAPSVLRSAHALPAAARFAEVLHYALVAGASEELAAMPTTGHPWHADRLAPHVEALGLPPVPPPASIPPPAPPPPGAAPAAPPVVVGKAEGFVARNHRTATDDRLAVIGDVVADASNPVWDVADRSRVRAAFDRWDELPKQQRQQVFGVATGALWLGDVS